jgi:diguanylate cyclase (GGDEF)-like protein
VTGRIGATPPVERIEAVVDLLARLATGDYTSRGARSSADDEIEGVNMLAEELQASHAELEQRVRERTEDLERLNRDILLFAELGSLLQACETVEEAYAVTGQGLGDMFEAMTGAMYLYRASRNVLERKAGWGPVTSPTTIGPTSCWALRRGSTHFVSATAPALSCPHIVQRTGDSLCVPMSAHGEIIGVLHLMSHQTTSQHRHNVQGPIGSAPDAKPFAAAVALLTDAKQQLAMAAAEQTSVALANLELRHKLQVQALRDPLTGLHNRRFAHEWMSREVARSDRAGQGLGVVMIDVDHFKRVNDVHGHDAGDELLKAIAEALRGALRPGDMPCRYGGEEFLILVPDIGLTTLHQRAEALRTRVADIGLSYRGAPLPRVTLSAGIAIYPEHGTTAAELVQAADTALYNAKHSGRNRTCTAQTTLPDHGR